MGPVEEPAYELSKGRVGPIDPIIRDSEGKIVDGFHRFEANPDWPMVQRDDIDTPRKHFAVRIARNSMRRVVPPEETANSVKRLMEEIIEEEGPGVNVVKEIVLDTGLKEEYVRRVLSGITAASVPLTQLRRSPSAPVSAAADSGEEGPPIEPVTAKLPPRDSQSFQNFVFNVISRHVGLPLDEMGPKISVECDINDEDAQNFIQGWKRANYDLWQTMYDSNDRLLVREPVARPELPSRETPITEMSPPQEMVFTRDEGLAIAMNWYPSGVVDAVWEDERVANLDDERKIPFLKAFLLVCFEKAQEAYTDNDLIEAAMNQL